MLLMKDGYDEMARKGKKKLSFFLCTISLPLSLTYTQVYIKKQKNDLRWTPKIPTSLPQSRN